MRERLFRKRDTLHVQALPRNPNTHLDYRTRFNEPWFDHLTALRLIFAAAMLASSAAIFARLVDAISSSLAGWCLAIAGALVIYAILDAVFQGRINIGLVWAAALAVFAFIIFFLGRLPDVRSTYLLLTLPSLLLAVGFAYLAGKQTAYWITANHQVEQQTMLRWRRIWSQTQPEVLRTACPERQTISILAKSMPVVFLAGFPLLDALSRRYSLAGAVSITLTMLLIALAVTWVVAHLAAGAPIPSPFKTLWAGWRTIQVFATYNRHETPAPGVFRFPSIGMNQVALRDLILSSAVALISISLIANVLPAPYPRPISEIFDPPKAPPVGFDRVEWDYIRSLPIEQVTEYMAALEAEKKAAIREQLQQPAIARKNEAIVRRALLATAFGFVVSPLLLVCLTSILVGSTINRFLQSLEYANATEQSKHTPWHVLIDRLINSPNSLERNHLFVGSSRYNDYPVLLHRDILKNHAHILGDTGARKTSLEIAPMATQLIAARDSSVLIIDLKGEPSLFHGLRAEAKSAGIPFRWFTTTPNWSSYSFNPFLQKHWSHFSSNQRVQIVLAALSLDYGTAYGRGFFTAMNEMVFANIVRKVRINSFDDMHDVLNKKEFYQAFGDEQDWKAARHLAALVNRLRTIYPLNLTPEKLPNRPDVFRNAIDLSELLEVPQVAYFYLKAPIEPLSTAGIAKLAIYSLFTAAAGLSHEKEKTRTYVMIDEFQQVISESIRQVLEQGRSLGATFVVAHQSKGQSRRDGVDITTTLDTCTSFKQTFRASDLQTIMELGELSGQGVFHRMAWLQNSPRDEDDEDEFSSKFSLDGSVQISEFPGPLMDRNTIMEISADQKASIVRFTEDSGYTRYRGLATPIYSDFHITEAEFKRRDKAPFPPVGPDTVSVQPDYGDVQDVPWPDVTPNDLKPLPGPFLLPADLDKLIRENM